MRVVGGKWRGQVLRAPKGRETRPTTDRNREALMSMLLARLDFDGLHVLDLFAGTGALGLEALSHGAAFCLFVETEAQARAAIRDNVEALNATGISKIFRRDATDLGPHKGAPYNLVFADPPYGKGLGEQALASLLAGDWLADDALIIIEEDKRAQFAAPSGFSEMERRVKGDSEFIFLEKA
jgi:16S rRNA (guanine966-N2)-methyltransferase